MLKKWNFSFKLYGFRGNETNWTLYIHFWICIKWLGLYMVFLLLIQHFPLGLVRFWTSSGNPVLRNFVTTFSNQFFSFHCMNNQKYTVPCFHSFTDAIWRRMTLWLEIFHLSEWWIHIKLEHVFMFLLGFNFNHEDGWGPSLAWLQPFPSEHTTATFIHC